MNHYAGSESIFKGKKRVLTSMQVVDSPKRAFRASCHLNHKCLIARVNNKGTSDWDIFGTSVSESMKVKVKCIIRWPILSFFNNYLEDEALHLSHDDKIAAIKFKFLGEISEGYTDSFFVADSKFFAIQPESLLRISPGRGLQNPTSSEMFALDPSFSK